MLQLRRLAAWLGQLLRWLGVMLGWHKQTFCRRVRMQPVMRHAGSWGSSGSRLWQMGCRARDGVGVDD
jgi:hypothetical protein